MLNNFLYLRKSIEIILYQNKDLEHLFITENEWQKLERYKKIFEIFREPTKRLHIETTFRGLRRRNGSVLELLLKAATPWNTDQIREWRSLSLPPLR